MSVPTAYSLARWPLSALAPPSSRHPPLHAAAPPPPALPRPRFPSTNPLSTRPMLINTFTIQQSQPRCHHRVALTPLGHAPPWGYFITQGINARSQTVVKCHPHPVTTSPTWRQGQRDIAQFTQRSYNKKSVSTDKISLPWAQC